jgi:peptidoglycan hydrolase-like protein with peptidoglycan-binding domain
MQREGGTIQLLDPQRGTLEISEAEFEQMAAGFLIPYNDRDGITGLSALDEGDAVTALQERLAAEGLYEDSPSGTFDEKTVEAVMAYRRRLMLPGPAEIDPLLALSLLEEPK